MTEGVGDKVSQVIFNCGTFFAGLSVSLYFSWTFTLWCIAYIPLMVLMFGIMGSTMKKAFTEKYVAGLALNGRIEEIMHSIKLVVAFANEDVDLKRFEEHAEANLKIAVSA